MLVLKGHTNSVQALAYTPDGETLISGGDDHTIRLWDVRTGRETGCLKGHTDSILTLSLHPDGKRLASGGHDKRVRLWNLADRQLLTAFPPFTSSINAVAFGPEGRLLATGADRGSVHTLRIREMSGGNETPWSHSPHSQSLWSLAFAPGPAEILAIGWGSGLVDVYDIVGQWNRHELSHPAGVAALTFSPDGQSLAALSGNTITLWNLGTGKARFRFSDHAGRASAVAYTLDARYIATGGWDSRVRLWDAQTGEPRGHFDWQLGRINAVAFAPDGMTAAVAGYAHDIVIWDVD